MLRLQRSDKQQLEKTVEQKASRLISTWEFPFIRNMEARAGKCTIVLQIDPVDYHMYEMIPIPIQNRKPENLRLFRISTGMVFP